MILITEINDIKIALHTWEYDDPDNIIDDLKDEGYHVEASREISEDDMDVLIEHTESYNKDLEIGEIDSDMIEIELPELFEELEDLTY